MQDLTTNPTPSPLPFSPLTDTGLAIQIEELSSVWVHLVNQGRYFDPRLSTEARLVADMCRAHTDRIVAQIRQGAAA